jgi:putative ribosome biogenesis GTPase RsgA
MKFPGGEFAMPLQRGDVLGFNFNRMVVEFTMLNRNKVVQCAISTAALDDLEDKRDVGPHQRVDQFMRLREVIEEFFDEQVRFDRPVVLRSDDFSIVASLRRPHRG